MANEKRIAVLIDADNISHNYIKALLDEIANHGIPTYKRIYGDWSRDALASWKNKLLDYSITPVHQYSYTVGKNATDSAMIIDAMDILYSANVDGFCLVSSDSDFTRLAMRLREAGMYVIGMGERKTPSAFIAACEKFIYLEVLTAQANSGENGKKTAEEKPLLADVSEIVPAIKVIIYDNADDDGWTSLSQVGNLLTKRYPDFDSRNYGFSRLSTLLKSIKEFEIDSRPSGDSKMQQMFIRIAQPGEKQEKKAASTKKTTQKKLRSR